MSLWYAMERLQQSYHLSERLVRAISNWNTLGSGSVDNIEQLLESGADVNQIHGTLLPLHCAAMVADSDTMLLLIDRGAEVNAIDGYERAALHYAAEKCEACVEVLLENGADIDLGDGNQNTALHWAAFKNHVHCARALLEHGADVNAADFNHDTPLSWAAMKGNLESIKLLLEHNAAVDTKNYNGLSPLMRCCQVQASGLNREADNACLEILLKAHGQFDLRSGGRGALPGLITGDNKLTEMLLPYCLHPRPLQDLCRSAIRQYLGRGFLPELIPQLPLPTSLQEFTLLQR